MSFREISPEEIQRNAISLIGTDWLLVTAEKDGKQNTMTASWGGIGVLWGKSVVYVFIRPQRYTKEFIDSADTFSLCIMDEKYKKDLSYLGSVSGRNEDKIAKVGYNVQKLDNTPYFDEAKLVLTCRKLYAQEMKPECFLDKSCDEKWYQNKDYHTMYVAEIEHVLTK